MSLQEIIKPRREVRDYSNYFGKQTATPAIFLWDGGLMTINVITELAVAICGAFRHCEALRSNLSISTIILQTDIV